MVEVLGSVQYLLQVLFEPILRLYSQFKPWLIRGVQLSALCLAVVMVSTSSSRVSAGYNNLSDVPADKMANLEAAWKVGIENGVSEAALAGMLGNANSESGFDPFLQQVGGPAWGFFQMEADRQARLKAFLAEKGASNDPVKASAASMEFVISELKADNMFLTYGLEGDANGTGRYAGPQSWDGPYRYDVLQYVQGGGKKISTSAEEFYKNTDVKKAAVEFMVSYERAHSSRDTLHLDQRLAMSEQIYEKFAGSVSSSDAKDEANSDSSDGSVSETLSGWAPSEDDVPNMPTDRDYKEDGLTFKDKVEQAGADLDTVEEAGIAKWKAERESSLARDSVDFVRMGIVLISLALLVAPSVLMMAYFSDLWLIGLDSPMLRLVTFNKLAVDYQRTGGGGIWFANRHENAHLSVKRMGAGDLFVWCAVFSIVGVLGISGYLFTAFGGAWQYIADALGYF